MVLHPWESRSPPSFKAFIIYLMKAFFMRLTKQRDPFDARPEAAFPAGHVERRELQALVRAAAEHPQGGPQGGDVLRAEQVLDAAPRDVPAHGLLDGGRLERGQVLGGPALGAAVIP